MSKDIYAIFNIEEEEKTSVTLFLIQSIFLGIFYGAFDVGAHALFLNVYPAEMIPKAYVLSGIVGILLTSLYARIQNRIPFSRLAVINLVFISISAALLRIFFHFTESNWLIFLIFIMMGPLNIIALLGFWGAVGRIFSLRQGKRLFGLIDSGQIFGAILSTFAIPVLVAVGFQQKNLLFLSSVSIGIALIMQIIISIKYNLNEQVIKTEKKQKRLPELLKNKYVLHMAIFVVMSMLAAFFIQYSFLSVTKINYPNHDDLTEFLGAFTGSLLLFTFLFKTFVYSKLMKTYGLKLSILISPFLLGVFTLVAVLIGTLSGYTIVSSSFIFFFLIIALSRLFSRALKDGVEVPSFKILYQSLKADIRYDVQAYVDGTINEIAALSAGLLLAVLGLFEFFKLIHFSYSLIIILGIWFFIARKLYYEYQQSLQKTLGEYKIKEEKETDISTLINSNMKVSSSYHEGLLYGLEIDFQLHPLSFENKLDKMLDVNNDYIKDYAVEKIERHHIFNLYHLIEPELKKKPIETDKLDLIKSNIKLEKSPGKDRIIKLVKSKNTDDRILAAYFIGKFYENSFFVYLKSLMRDLQSSVRISAIKAAVNSGNKDFCPLICDYLDHSSLISYAYEALKLFGDKSLQSIDQVFYKTGTNHRVLLRIIKLLGEIGTSQAQELLLKKLDHPNEEILLGILNSLKDTGFKADDKNITFIHQIIEHHIGVMAQNFAVKAALNDWKEFVYLKKAVDEELNTNYNTLYLLLSLAYDSKSITHVKDNIESGTSEGASYALELLDLFVHDEIKPKLFPIIEDISLVEKIKQLQLFYPVEKLSLKETLISIINRDINNTNIWTKVNAIYAFSEIELDDIPTDLIAHLFNPIDILRQTASFVVNLLNQEKYTLIKSRVNQIYGDENELDSEQKVGNRNYLLIEKTWFLNSIEYFQNTSGRYLYHLAKSLKDLKSTIYEFSDVIKSDLSNKILIVKGESSELIIDENESIELNEGKLFDMNNLLNGVQQKISLKTNEKSVIYYFDKNELIKDVFDFQEIEQSVMRWIKTQIEI